MWTAARPTSLSVYSTATALWTGTTLCQLICCSGEGAMWPLAVRNVVTFLHECPPFSSLSLPCLRLMLMYMLGRIITLRPRAELKLQLAETLALVH